MALTKTQIISRAIDLLNKGPITSLNDGGVFSQSAEDTFDYLLPSILAQKNWRFATKLIQLSQDVVTPIIDNWNYIYSLPADFLVLRRTYPFTYDYEIFENKKLYTNLNEIKLQYRFLPVITSLPAHFIDYFITELGHTFSLTGASSETLELKLEKLADKKRIQATAVDAQSHPNQEMLSNSWINARNGGFGSFNNIN